MKKEMLPFLLMPVVLLACSKETKTEPEEEIVKKEKLLASIVETTVTGIKTDTFLYTSTMQFSSVSHLGKSQPTNNAAVYADGKLTGWKYTIDPTLTSYEKIHAYSYANDRIVKAVSREFEIYYPGRTRYDSLVYNQAGHLAYIFTKQTTDSGVLETVDIEALTWDNNGNLIEARYGVAEDNLTWSYRFRRVFTYDTKRNPYFHNTGCNPLFWFYAKSNESVSENNVLKMMQYESEDGGTTEQLSEINTFTYTYDADEYPMKMIKRTGTSENDNNAVANESAFKYTIR